MSAKKKANKKNAEKKAAKAAAKAKSAEMKKAAADAPKDDGKKKDAENRSTVLDGKRLTLGGMILETIETFNACHKDEFDRPITRKELAASIKLAKDALVEKKIFKKYERPKKDYTKPTASIGQTLTIEVLSGNDKGKKVSGIYIDWKDTNGCAKVYGSVGTDNPKNHWGRPVTETATPATAPAEAEKAAS